MKYSILLLLVLATAVLKAQSFNQKDIINTWVLQKVTNTDDSEISDDNLQKYIYVKYTFSSSGKINYSGRYDIKGTEFLYEISNGNLLFKSAEGGAMNAYIINILSKNNLVLTQIVLGRAYDPGGLKYYFIPENVVQNNIILKPEDISTIINGDTVYNQNPKLYARYKNDDFQAYLYKNVGVNMDKKAGRLAATFVVSKLGIADSLKIEKGISPEFDKGILKAFSKAKKDWKPALLNGKPVSVKLAVAMGYLTSETALPSMSITQDAIRAFNQKDYSMAISLYDKAIALQEADVSSLFARGVCKMMTGDMKGAVKDWRKVKLLGSTIADKVLEKFGG